MAGWRAAIDPARIRDRRMADAPRPLTDRTAARARARAAWSDLGARLGTVSPAAVGRAALVTAVVAGSVAVVVGTWPALLPFAIGGLIAYTVLPLVDALDGLMPRALAATVALLALAGVVVGVFVVVVPPLAAALVALTSVIPSSDEIDRAVETALGQLPASAQDVSRPVLVAVVSTVKEGLGDVSAGLDDLGPTIVNAVLGVAAAALGLIVLPAWLLTALSSKRRAAAAVDARLAGWLRPDFWAVVRMLDRAAGTYLRGFVVLAFLVGVLMYIGLTLSSRLGGPTYQGSLALSVLAGAFQLIPEFGWILGFSPALLLAFVDPERAAVYIAVYLGARWLGGTVVGRRVSEGRLGVHPLVLIPGVVALSQLGVAWLLLSAPILTFASDLVRYLHGRLSEPPSPAGLLPGQPLPSRASTAATPIVPAVYLRGPRLPATRGRPVTGPVNPTP
jgi:predicted PurR-regulated permease PerM